MGISVTEIWRHPIKSHGRQLLDRVVLEAGCTMPGDRVWAVAHEAAKVNRDAPGWAECVNFNRGSKAPQLMAIEATLNDTDGTLTLTHPERDTITFAPDTAQGEVTFLNWVAGLTPAERAQPAHLFKAPGRGMTDTDFPSVSINSHASLRALSQRAGVTLSPKRWRGNIWVDGAAAWEELDWIGSEISIGGVRLKVEEPVVRCKATTANPETGRIDVNTLAVLNDAYNHQNFGVYATVLDTGPIAVGDPLLVL